MFHVKHHSDMIYIKLRKEGGGDRSQRGFQKMPETDYAGSIGAHIRTAPPFAPPVQITIEFSI